MMLIILTKLYCMFLCKNKQFNLCFSLDITVLFAFIKTSNEK